jgi:hypothetical protein
MLFTYEGFRHEGETRYFSFRGKDEGGDARTFCVAVRCLLFAENKVPLQAGPQFCLGLLQAASIARPLELDRFHRYSVVAEDFRPLLLERARVAATKAARAPANRTFRKPAQGSQLVLH